MNFSNSISFSSINLSITLHLAVISSIEELDDIKATLASDDFTEILLSSNTSFSIFLEISSLESNSSESCFSVSSRNLLRLSASMVLSLISLRFASISSLFLSVEPLISSISSLSLSIVSLLWRISLLRTEISP